MFSGHAEKPENYNNRNKSLHAIVIARAIARSNLLARHSFEITTKSLRHGLLRSTRNDDFRLSPSLLYRNVSFYLYGFSAVGLRNETQRFCKHRVVLGFARALPNLNLTKGDD